MKTNTRIRKDTHGLYVRTDGSVFRPVLTPHSYPVCQPLWRTSANGHPYEPDATLFVEGEAVKARHVSQTPFASITTADGRKAFWWSHGMYMGKKSDECWIPKP